MRKILYRPCAFMDVFMQVGRNRPLKEKGEELEENKASPMEDLMKEHGFVERILIMYQRMIDMAIRGQDVDVSIINRSAQMIHDYINNHHERDEERYVFPKFKEASYIVDIVDTLKEQHDSSRKIAKELIDLSARGASIGMDDRKRLMYLCGAFSYMYLAHIAHENTILFPVFYDIVSSDYLEDIREKMEEGEKKVLGETGFRGIVGRLSELEKRVGSYDLNQFTPRI
jgi:hemerythrin-like domain-containing protein